MPNLKLVAANDTVSALIAMADALAGQQTVFVTPPETNGLMPEVHGLPDFIDGDVALIVESSGSTGVPKRLELSRLALLASAAASDARLGGLGQWLLALPINFVAGANVLVRSLVAETQPVMMNPSLPFTAEGFSRAASMLSAERRYTSLVPTQLKRLLDQAPLDEFLLRQLQRFDAILVGGQAIDASLKAQARELNVNLVTSYGMTETCGGCVYDGIPLDGVEVTLDAEGQILIRGQVLAERVANEEGWYQTNDLGQFDELGRLQILGRTNRVLNSGGLKVSLDAIEAAIREIGGVADAAAIALADAEWGERAAVVYVGSPEVADYIAGEALLSLGSAAKPVRVIRVASLPRLSNGKTDYLSLSSHFDKNPLTE